jgi:Xaa-Pro aminopeptidase
VTSPVNWFYLTGFTGEAGVLLVEPRGVTLVTDGRFTVQAKQEVSGVAVVLQKEGLWRTCGEQLKRRKRRSVGFDSDQMTVAQLGALKRATGAAIELREAPGTVQALRACKDSSELAKMRKAALLAGDVMEAAIKQLKPGIREFEVAAEIEYQMRTRGASGPAFETIVAFGERAALPHARPTAKRLKKGQLVCWTWVLYWKNIAATSRERFLWGRRPPRFACGIRRSGKRRRRPLTKWRLDEPAVKWTQRPEGYSGHTGLISFSCTVRGMDWAWRSMRIRA